MPAASSGGSGTSVSPAGDGAAAVVPAGGPSAEVLLELLDGVGLPPRPGSDRVGSRLPDGVE